MRYTKNSYVCMYVCMSPLLTSVNMWIFLYRQQKPHSWLGHILFWFFSCSINLFYLPLSTWSLLCYYQTRLLTLHHFLLQQSSSLAGSPLRNPLDSILSNLSLLFSSPTTPLCLLYLMNMHAGWSLISVVQPINMCRNAEKNKQLTGLPSF